jgi:hypothetical protein
VEALVVLRLDVVMAHCAVDRLELLRMGDVPDVGVTVLAVDRGVRGGEQGRCIEMRRRSRLAPRDRADFVTIDAGLGAWGECGLGRGGRHIAVREEKDREQGEQAGNDCGPRAAPCD